MYEDQKIYNIDIIDKKMLKAYTWFTHLNIYSKHILILI